MAKKIYQVGEPCERCSTPTIQGPSGVYCKKCYIEWKNKQDQSGQQSATLPTRDFEAENRGKVRHGLICAFIEGKTVDEIKAQMPDFKLLLMPLENLVMGSIKDDAAPKPIPAPVPVIQEGDEINVEDIPF